MTYCRPLFALCFLFAILTCIGGCARPKSVTEPKAEEKKQLAVGKRILMVVAQSNFSDKEFETLQGIFEAEGAELQLAAPRATTANGTDGLLVTTEISLELADVAKYNAIVFVGGKGASALFRNEYALALVRDAVAQEKVLGATGAATLILALAGVLEGKNATAPPRLAKSFADVAKCAYTELPVVADENIVTASGPAACESFAHTILKMIQ